MSVYLLHLLASILAKVLTTQKNSAMPQKPKEKKSCSSSTKKSLPIFASSAVCLSWNYSESGKNIAFTFDFQKSFLISF